MRGRPSMKRQQELLQIKERAINLIKANPTLSITRVAEHFNISQPTISKWFKEANLKKWF